MGGVYEMKEEKKRGACEAAHGSPFVTIGDHITLDNVVKFFLDLILTRSLTKKHGWFIPFNQTLF